MLIAAISINQKWTTTYNIAAQPRYVKIAQQFLLFQEQSVVLRLCQMFL